MCIRDSAIILMAGIRERVEEGDHPKAFEGFPFAPVSYTHLDVYKRQVL